jgi:drug/metabolite transporter (DMT)-like permease
MGVEARLVNGRRTIFTAPLVSVALVALGAALWGSDGAFRQPLVSPVARWSPYTIVLYEHVILTAVCAPYLLRHARSLRRLDRGGWLAAVGVAWGGSALATLAFTTAFEYGNPDVVVLLQKTQPLWAIAAAAAVMRERPLRVLVWFLAPALVGTYLLSFGGMAPADAFTGAQGKAALLALAAAGLWGAATAFGRRALVALEPGMVTAVRFTLALPLLGVIALWERVVGPPASAHASDWTRLVGLALVPGLVALVLYYRGLVHVPASVATFAELAFPATALVVNYFALDASVSATQLLGFAILWATIALLHRLPVELPATGESLAIRPASAAG